MPRKKSAKTLEMPARKPPTPAAVEGFVVSGPGTDTIGAAGPRPKGVRVTVEIPRELHKRFKASCALRETTMHARLLEAVEGDCAEIQE